MMPSDLFEQLTGNHSQLQALINKCRTNAASTADRTLRNSLLKLTVKRCLLRVKIWAYGQFTAGVLTSRRCAPARLPAARRNRRTPDRTEAANAVAEVKVKVVNEDFIRALSFDRSSGENAAQVACGWPAGVKNTLIVITSAVLSRKRENKEEKRKNWF